MIKTEDYLRDIVTTFFAQKRIILPTAAAILAFAVFVAFFWPPTYAAQGAILVKGKKLEKSPEALERTEIKMFEITKRDLISETNIISSHDVVLQTIAALRGEGKPYRGEPDDPENNLKLIQDLQNRLTTEIVTDSNVIDLTLADKDPERAVTVLDELMRQYIVHRSAVLNPDQAVTFYEQQVDKFDQGLKEMEDQLMGLAQRFQSPDPAKEIENNLVLKKDLEQQLDLVRSQLIEKELYLEYLQDAVDSKKVRFFSSIANPSINFLSEKLQGLVLERGNVLRVYHQDSEKVRAMDQQITATFASLRAEVESYADNVRNEARILEDKAASLEGRLRSMAARNIQLHAFLVQSRRIERELELRKGSYETFAKRLEETRINTSSDANALFAISVISAPHFTGEPVFPKKRTVIPLGLLVGLITGLSLGYLKEYFDHTFKKPEDAAKFAGLPTLFSIPSWEKP